MQQSHTAEPRQRHSPPKSGKRPPAGSTKSKACVCHVVSVCRQVSSSTSISRTQLCPFDMHAHISRWHEYLSGQFAMQGSAMASSKQMTPPVQVQACTGYRALCSCLTNHIRTFNKVNSQHQKMCKHWISPIMDHWQKGLEMQIGAVFNAFFPTVALQSIRPVFELWSSNSY